MIKFNFNGCLYSIVDAFSGKSYNLHKHTHINRGENWPDVSPSQGAAQLSNEKFCSRCLTRFDTELLYRRVVEPLYEQFNVAFAVCR